MTTAVLIVSILTGLALAATCGCRIFLTMLGACAAARYQLIPWQADFGWLSGDTALYCLAVAAVVEIILGYVNRFNGRSDILTLPLAIAAGALLSTAVLPMEYPWLRWALGLIGGGVCAGIVHVSTGMLLRLFAKIAPRSGTGRLATAKSIFALGGTLLSIFLPISAGIIALFSVGWLGWRSYKKLVPLGKR
jgi:hypothetical protein